MDSLLKNCIEKGFNRGAHQVLKCLLMCIRAFLNMDSSQHRFMVPPRSPDLYSLYFFPGYLEGHCVRNSSRFRLGPGRHQSTSLLYDPRKADLRTFDNSCGVDVMPVSVPMGEILNSSYNSCN
ncbi:hypothetical protein AVEN_243638-1 [Araneus ventricosus]|uniref:Uncharacterized protein n=1 Tax=Araneus ventricosus TaxID=182803 RepID=A0A4Y2A5E8_ARAVE|nr:hypothetical protein AVEN_243638-1 [Araneus ventricosus]